MEYYEFTIRFGNFELLATSGFFGVLESSEITPFFGSALQNLPQSITESVNTITSDSLFQPLTTKYFYSDARLLNQYIKKDAPKQWQSFQG